MVTAWSNVHIFADLVGTLPKQQIASLDSDALVDVFKNAPPVSRPEYAPFDFSKNAYPDIPALSALRLFSREAMVLRVEDGALQVRDPVRRRHEAVQAGVVTVARH